jgi:hypothetical protein
VTWLAGVHLGSSVGGPFALLVVLAGVAAGSVVQRPIAVTAFGATRVSADSQPEPVLVELQIGRLTSRTVSAYRVGREALVPLTALLQLGEVGYRLSLDGVLEATLNPGAQRLRIDIHRDTMSLGKQRVGIEPQYRLFKDNDLYISARRLGALFQTTIFVDWEELSVTFVDAEQLPIGKRLRREVAREAFLRRTGGVSPDRTLGLERPRWDGLVLDYSFLAAGPEPLAGGAYAVALGTDALGGSLALGVQSVGPTGDGHAQGQGSWTGVWRDARWLKQLRIGDAFTTGPRLRAARGVMVTNAPYLRSPLLGATRYDGRLDPGWTIEAYRGGDLVALDSADHQGRFTVDLPVRYGENPVDFVAYGPLGEIRRFNRTYRVLSDLLPVRQFEYGVSAGQCTAPTCRATGNLDLRYGITERWTVRAGAEQFWRDSIGNRTHPYAAMVLNPTNAWAVTLEGVGGASATAGLQFEPSVNLQLTAGYTAYARDVAPTLQATGLRSAWTLAGFVRPIAASPIFFFDAQVGHVASLTGGTTTARLDASGQAHDVRLVPFVRLQRDALVGGMATTRSFAGVDAFVLPRPALGRLLGALWIRTHVEQELNGELLSAQVVAARPLWAGVRLEMGVGTQRGTPGATFTLSLSSYLPAVRMLTLVNAPTAGGTTASQFVQGSVLWNRANGRLSYTAGPSLERAGLAGRVFLDDNGNDRWDPGEPAVPGVRVSAGASSASSDSSGRFRVWDLVPFEPILVTVDSLSIDSPLLVPAFASASLIPGPNRFTTLDIPLVRAGVVEGRVLGTTPLGPRGLGGVTLVLTNRRTGERRSFASFSDGDFYVLGVKPGDYDLTVDPRVLDVLQATVVPARLTLAPTASRVGVSGLELRLTPKP